MMSNGSRLKVAICGAGIGGLTCALALSQYPDIEIDVFESAKKLAEVGAGIGLFPRPWKVLQMLGIDQELLQVTETRAREGPVTSFRYRKSDQREGKDFFTLVTHGSLITLHRADFQKVLLRHLPHSCRTLCSKRLRSYSQPKSGPIELLFDDGTTAFCDVLIGADGIKSSVRRTLLNEKAQRARSEGRLKEAAEILLPAEPTWSGTIAYRALIPAERLRARAPSHRLFSVPVQYLGKGGYVISYPISGGKMFNFVAFTCRHDLENTKHDGPWVSSTDKSAFASTFSNWEPEVQALLDCVESPLKWAIHTIRPMRSFVSGRVAIMGDAAHAMTPHQGSGAGQAIEDAYLLATVLGHPETNRTTINRALRIYDEIRRPAAQRVQEVSRMNGRYFTFELENNLNLDRLSLKQQGDALQQISAAFVRNWEWAWSTSINDSIEEALRRLESSDNAC